MTWRMSASKPELLKTPALCRMAYGSAYGSLSFFLSLAFSDDLLQALLASMPRQNSVKFLEMKSEMERDKASDLPSSSTWLGRGSPKCCLNRSSTPLLPQSL